MSIVRVGMAEDKKFKDGYDAIFKKGKATGAAKKPAGGKKPAGKKASAKKK